MDPERLVFAGGHIAKIKELSSAAGRALQDAAEQATRALYQEHTFYDPPDVACRLRDLMSQSSVVPGLTRARGDRGQA